MTRRMSSEGDGDPLYLIHYDSEGLHTRTPEVIEGVKKLVARSATVPYAMKALKDAKRILIQGNDTDCGVFVCMYLNGLVSTGFKTVFTWVSCNGVTSRTYRRGMRRDVASHAVGELFVQLYMEEVEVLPQPHARVDDDGCMLFPTEDEVRTDLAQLSPDRNSMEVDGVLLGSRRNEATKVKASGTGGLVKRGGTSEYTGVWYDLQSAEVVRQNHCRPGNWEAGSPWGYLKEEDAAYAYAAGAFVIRRKDHFPKMMSLSDAEMAALEGAIVDDVRHLVQKRKWYRWREWRKAMDYIGVLPGTPFKPEPASTPPRDARDDRDGSSSSSRETTSNRRKAGTARSQEDARTARSGKRSRDPDLEDDEGREEPAATGPGPVSSDDDPNEALPRVNPRVDGDEDATQEEASDSAPVTRAEMTALRKMQMDTAATMARLETALLASLANHQAKKRNVTTQEASATGSTHVRTSSSPILQCALKFFTREQRVEGGVIGLMSCMVGAHCQSWTASAMCALVDVMAAIEQYQLQYDPTTSSWAWGRHGLRLSADGVERQEPAKQAHSESDG
ncbi:unnamed protein product [Closterium sp. NIES-65]|nr:unnamed protein product [Closterium sp. NIES-65]